MNRYFNNLEPVFQQYFEKFGVEPANNFEADAYFRSFNNITKNATFEVVFQTPIKIFGKEQASLTIDRKNFLDAFFPEVWKKLSFGQKLQSVNFAFNNMVEQDVLLKKHNPQLLFSCSNDDYSLGKEFVKNNKIILEVGVKQIAKQNQSLSVLQTLRHEVFHAQQHLKNKLLVDKIEHNNKQKISNGNLTEHQLSMLNPMPGGILQRLNDIVVAEETLDVFLPTHKHFAQLELWNNIKETVEWRILLQICYLLDEREKGAFDKQQKYYNAVNAYFDKKFGKQKFDFLSLFAQETTAEQYVQLLNDSYGYKLDQDSLKHLANLNQIVYSDVQKNVFGEYYFGNNDITSKEFFGGKSWFGIRYLLNVYQTKTTFPIDQKLVDMLNDKKIEAINNDTTWLK